MSVVLSGLTWTHGNPQQAEERLKSRRNTVILSQKERPAFCDFCTLPIPEPAGLMTGYGRIGAGGYGRLTESKVACYACCGWLCLIDMLACHVGERCFDAFYYDPKKRTVRNWPGSVEFPVYATGTRTPVRFGGPRDVCYRVYFRGPQGTLWSGTFYDTQIAGDLLRHVRRIRK